MPIYEYACHDCKKFVDVIARRVADDAFAPACPECGGHRMTRMISSFAFHLSFQSQIDQLDPKYDRMIDASNPGLSFDSLVKKYQLERPMTTPDERKKLRASGKKQLAP